eukprot:CAMPEP_0171574208 /NCGR_PEP_ID=MMETSP0961-20121227/5215_1 /TAXON_ID=87120 /ORGANISM="Aurantiochytrium limacinum, Strain ATCCMYA-1381" /LENGTH=135 /DNA_ID=CAMNT_0012129469 /DNA_START=210 /DNA_END=617 /DNA_ORIENTATION=+
MAMSCLPVVLLEAKGDRYRAIAKQAMAQSCEWATRGGKARSCDEQTEEQSSAVLYLSMYRCIYVSTASIKSNSLEIACSFWGAWITNSSGSFDPTVASRFASTPHSKLLQGLQGLQCPALVRNGSDGLGRATPHV